MTKLWSERRLDPNHCHVNLWRPSGPHRPSQARLRPPAPTRRRNRTAPACLQVVVLDKLDYCATLNNLNAVKDAPNFK